MKSRAALLLLASFWSLSLPVLRAETVAPAKPVPAAATPEWIRNVDYVGDGNPKHQLDLMLPADRAGKKLPLVIFFHGGSWAAGSRKDGNGIVEALAKAGYAAATTSYRLSDEAAWPAQIFDCKAAIRFLRAKAADYQIDPDRIGVTGMSAGGHLASLLGTSGGVAELEGTLGDHLKTSSKVECVVNFFGPEDFLTIEQQEAAHPLYLIGGKQSLAKLFGGPVIEQQEKAKQASPVTWIGRNNPPFLTAHGTSDPIVPFAQAQELHQGLLKAGVESHLIAMKGMGHGFYNDELNKIVMQFLNQHLLGKKAEIPVEKEIAAPGK